MRTLPFTLHNLFLLDPIIFTNNSPVNPLSVKPRNSDKRCRPSTPSPYFGERSKIVTAITPKGFKKMKLKNAVKKQLQFFTE